MDLVQSLLVLVTNLRSVLVWMLSDVVTPLLFLLMLLVICCHSQTLAVDLLSQRSELARARIGSMFSQAQRRGDDTVFSFPMHGRAERAGGL